MMAILQHVRNKLSDVSRVLSLSLKRVRDSHSVKTLGSDQMIINHLDVKIRCIEHSDLKTYTSLVNKARADRPRQRKLTPEQVVSIYFSDPNYDTNGHFLAFVGDKPVGEALGYIELKNSSKEDSYGLLTMSILPEYRGLGIGTLLVERVCAYLNGHNVRKVEVTIPRVCIELKRLCEKLGFHECGRLYEIAYDFRKGLPRILPPSGYIVRTVKFPEEKLEFLEVLNKSFCRTNNSHQVLTLGDFERILNFPEVKSNYFVAEREADKGIVGVISNYIDHVHNRKNNAKEGTIDFVGVLPSERRKKIGASLIVRSLEWMNKEGVATAFSSVTSTNMNCIGFFRSLGFDLRNENIVYRLQMW